MQRPSGWPFGLCPKIFLKNPLDLFRRYQNLKKKVQKILLKGQQPLKYLPALKSIFSGDVHQNDTKLKSCGYFDPSFRPIEKAWPLKADKAIKGLFASGLLVP